MINNNKRRGNYEREHGRPYRIILILLLVVWAPQAQALPDGQQIIKYLNPIHEKSYLNEKQDRLIKKKHLKIQLLPA